MCQGLECIRLPNAELHRLLGNIMGIVFLLTHFFIHISYVGSNCPFIYEVEETKSHRCLIKSNDEKNWGGGGSKKKKNDKEHNM